MANDMNVVIIEGHFVKDPELKSNQNGSSFCNFSMACNKSWKTADGEKKEAVSYFNFISWGKQAEIINQYCSKGFHAIVHGRLEQRSYDDSSGVKKYIIEITVAEIKFLSKAGEVGKKITDDDIPY